MQYASHTKKRQITVELQLMECTMYILYNTMYFGMSMCVNKYIKGRTKETVLYVTHKRKHKNLHIVVLTFGVLVENCVFRNANSTLR